MSASFSGSAIALPFTENIYLTSVLIAGLHHHQADSVINMLKEGLPLVLKREPESPHDSFAIEVVTETGVKLGYIPRANNHIPARLMDAGKYLSGRVIEVKKQGGCLEIRVGMYMQNL